MCFLFFSPQALSNSLIIAKANDPQPATQHLIQALKLKLSSALPTWSIKIMQASDAAVVNNKNAVILTLGRAALSAVIKTHNSHSPFVIAVFISRSSYLDLIQSTENRRRVTAIYSEPAPYRQLALIRALLGGAISVSVISSNTSRENLADIKAVANKMDVSINMLSLSEHTNSKKLLNALQGSSALLLQKDKVVFEAIPLDTLLVLAYDIGNLGIIGYSSGLVKNGALATTYSSLDDMANSIAGLVKAFDHRLTIPAADFAEFYSIAINPYVAKSLGIKILSQQQLKKRVVELLKGSG